MHPITLTAFAAGSLVAGLAAIEAPAPAPVSDAAESVTITHVEVAGTTPHLRPAAPAPRVAIRSRLLPAAGVAAPPAPAAFPAAPAPPAPVAVDLLRSHLAGVAPATPASADAPVRGIVRVEAPQAATGIGGTGRVHVRTTAPAIGTGRNVATPPRASSSARWTSTRTGDDGKVRTIEVADEDGRVEVRVNGKRIADDRVRREDGRIVILDGGGDELETVFLRRTPGGVAIGDASTMRWRNASEAPAVVGTLQPAPVMLGITMSEPGDALASHLGLDPNATTIITSVSKDLAADRAGIEVHDVVVTINGTPPADGATLRSTLRAMEPGDVITLGVVHKGSKREVDVTVDEWKPQPLRQLQSINVAPFEGGGGGAGQITIVAPKAPRAPRAPQAPAPPAAVGIGGGGGGEDAEMSFEVFVPDVHLQFPSGLGFAGEGRAEEIRRLLQQLFDENLHEEIVGSMERFNRQLDQELPELEVRVRELAEQAERGASRMGDRVDERLERVEQRLERIEEMIQQLIERRRGRGGGGAGGGRAGDPTTT